MDNLNPSKSNLLWLSYRPNIKKTPSITRTIEILDPYFNGEPSEITSGLRTPHDQIKIIFEKLARHRLDEEFEEFKMHFGSDLELKIQVGDDIIYWWQRAWSRLLNIGDIVNPPYPAKCLFDYFRPGSSGNKNGQIIDISPHQRGTAFDIGGGSNLIEKAKRVMKAYQDGRSFLNSYLIERINNAVHCDTRAFGEYQ